MELVIARMRGSYLPASGTKYDVQRRQDSLSRLGFMAIDSSNENDKQILPNHSYIPIGVVD